MAMIAKHSLPDSMRSPAFGSTIKMSAWLRVEPIPFVRVKRARQAEASSNQSTRRHHNGSDRIRDNP